MCNIKGDTKGLISKTETVSDIENKFMVTKGEIGMGGWWEEIN